VEPILADYDLVILGGGIFGLASAYHILRQNQKLHVLVIDKEGDVGQGNTAKSAGGFRAGLFTSEANRVLSDTSVDFYTYVKEKRGVDLGLEFAGYLIILSPREFEIDEPVIQLFQKEKKVRVLKSEELREKLKMNVNFTGDEEARILGVHDVKVGLLGFKCGHLQADKLASFYKKEILNMGGDFMFNTRVERLVLGAEKPLNIPREPRVWQRKKVASVITDRGTIGADSVVMALGAWTAQLLDPLGIDCMAKPKKRQLFVVKPDTEDLQALFHTEGMNQYNVIPMTFIAGGPYFKADRSEKTFWIAMADDLGRGFGLDDNAEDNYYYDSIHPVLSKYFPQFQNARPINKWAGSYHVNSLDGNPVIFREVNMIVACGGSGTGIIKGDAVGRIVAALHSGDNQARLFGDLPFDTQKLSISNRNVERERFIF